MNTPNLAGAKDGFKAWPWFIGLALAFALTAGARIFVSDSVELDEAEQIVLTQTWGWGYAAQPPLYTWLQKLIFTVFGTGIPALAFCKMGLLFVNCCLVFLCIKTVTANTRAATVGMLGVFLLPHILWESLRDLTHSIVATTMASLTLYALLRLLKRRDAAFYALLGLAAGGGVLSKYNFGMFLAALVLAVLSLRESRSTLLNGRALISLAVFCLVVAPHLHWALTHPAEVMAESGKLRENSSLALWQAWGLSFFGLVFSVVGFLAPMIVITLAVLRRAPANSAESSNVTMSRRVIERTVWFGLALCVVMVFAARAHFKVRWMQPLLFVAPIYLGLWFAARATPARTRRLLWVSAIAGAVVMFSLPVAVVVQAPTKHPSRLNAPFSELAHRLKEHDVRPAVIVADSRWIGGNLALAFPGSGIVVPEYARLPMPTNVVWLVAWEGDRYAGTSDRLATIISNRLGMNLHGMQPQYEEAQRKFAEQKMKLGYIEIRPASQP